MTCRRIPRLPSYSPCGSTDEVAPLSRIALVHAHTATHTHTLDAGRQQMPDTCFRTFPLQAAAAGVLLPGMADGEQRTDAWHDLRDSRLTASAFSNALGCVRWWHAEAAAGHARTQRMQSKLATAYMKASDMLKINAGIVATEAVNDPSWL